MKLKKGSAAAKAYMAKIRAKRKKVKKSTIAKPKRAARKVVKAARKKAAKKMTSIHKDTASHNVRISVMSGNIYVYSAEEFKFLQSESKKSKGYKYRGKILFGAPIVLKETAKGTPVAKFYVDTLEVANALSKDLNKSHKLSRVKSKKI